MKKRNSIKKRNRRRRRRMGVIKTGMLLALLFCGLAFLPGGIRRAAEAGRKMLEAEGGAGVEISLDNLYSKAAMVTDLDSGKCIGKKNSGKKIYPASLTKIMTVLLSIEKLDNLKESIVVPEDIFPALYAEGASMAGFQPGETASYEELLYGAMLPSGAECCQTLAKAVSGSEEGFAQEMNEKARELGMKHTHFTNATGLQDSEHYTTAEDLTLLLEDALKNQTFYEIFTAAAYSTTASNIYGEGFTFYSTMRQEMSAAQIQDSHILGGKTGYTSEAGLCLASIGRVGEKTYLVVTADAEGSHETEPYHILDAVSVYEELER